MDVAERIHEQLTKCGIKLAASLPDDWVAPLIERIAADNHIRHVRVAREAEAIAICSGAFFGGVRAVALMGATGLLTCTGELATLNLRHQIPVFLIARFPSGFRADHNTCIGLRRPGQKRSCSRSMRQAWARVRGICGTASGCRRVSP